MLQMPSFLLSTAIIFSQQPHYSIISIYLYMSTTYSLCREPFFLSAAFTLSCQPSSSAGRFRFSQQLSSSVGSFHVLSAVFFVCRQFSFSSSVDSLHLYSAPPPSVFPDSNLLLSTAFSFCQPPFYIISIIPSSYIAFIFLCLLSEAFTSCRQPSSAVDSFTFR